MSGIPILCITELKRAQQRLPDANKLIVSPHLKDRAVEIREHMREVFDIEVQLLPEVAPTFWELRQYELMR